MHGILRVKGMLSIKYEDWRVLRRHNCKILVQPTGDPSLLRWSLAARCPHAVIGSLMIPACFVIPTVRTSYIIHYFSRRVLQSENYDFK
jgi:hypothetical protein